uniref:Putative cation efflux system protein n=1 Tax=uncultured bacterium pES01019D12 TaxID=355333 RepID=A0EJK2_9BACT|nr:putative cation efflux system protein [uncultured bacterium pES01019D12]
MITAIIRWSLNNRLLVLLLTAILVAWGIQAVRNTPIDALPDLSDVQVIIKTSYPGQAPQVVEDQVTYPLTTALLAVPGAVDVRGYSFFGDSYVYIIFEDGTDLYWARSRVLEYLNQVAGKLPPTAKPALGPDATGVGWVYEYALVDRSGGHDLADLRAIQDWFLKFELQTVHGVAEVATIGGMVKQYQVVIDPDAMRAYKLSLAQVRKAIQGGNREVGGSVIEMGEAEYMVRSTGYLSSIEDLEKIPLGVNDKGTPVRLKDVADIRMGPQLRRGIAELNGEGEVVGGVIVMRFGENARTTIEGVKKRLAELADSLPEGVEVVETYDRSALIERSVDTLKSKLVEEFLVVVLVCILFLFHFRSSLVIILSLPVGILIAFVVMHAQGLNANIMSLGGIAIAIGAMVDAAIVMIETVHKKMEREDYDPANHWEVIAEAASEVGPPLFFSLLIITLSFLPVFTLQAQEGPDVCATGIHQDLLNGRCGTAVDYAGTGADGLFYPRQDQPEHKTRKPLFTVDLQAGDKAVTHKPVLVLVTAAGLLVVGLWPATQLGSEFMPDLNEGDLMYMPTTFPGISIGKAQQLLQQTDKLIRSVPEVKMVFGKIGRAETATDPAPLTMIESVIQLKDPSEWRAGFTIDDIKDELNQRLKIPGLTNAWVWPIKTRIDMQSTGIKTPVGIKVAGGDLGVIQKIGKDIEAVLLDVPGTASAFSERVAGGRYVTIDINREAASRYALNIDDIQDVISTAIGGMNVTETVEGLQRYPVNLRYPRYVRDSLDQLKLLPIVTPGGQHIPLQAVADLRIEDGPPMIKSENARLNGWIYVDIKGVDLGTYVENARQIVADKIDLPAGYSITWSGQYEYMQRAKEHLAVVIPITLVTIMLLLFFNFKNMTEVLIILGTLPMALIGGLWLLYLLDYNLSVAVGVGFIALAGVAVEIGVVMLVYLKQALENIRIQVEKQGRPLSRADLENAITEGALMRIRPIMMTVAAIIAGLLPIMLGSGTGSEVMRRIAAPMVGGMVSATILTLAVIPAIFLLWQQRHVTQ